MNAPSIVKRFDVLKYTQTGLFSCFIFFMMHQLRLQRAEKALRDSVIPTVTLATHTAFAAVRFKLLSKCVTGILTASIGVDYFGRLPLLSEEGHPECIDDQVGSHSV